MFFLSNAGTESDTGEKGTEREGRPESQLLRLSLRLGRDRDSLVWWSRQAEAVAAGKRLW